MEGRGEGVRHYLNCTHFTTECDIIRDLEKFIIRFERKTFAFSTCESVVITILLNNLPIVIGEIQIQESEYEFVVLVGLEKKTRFLLPKIGMQLYEKMLIYIESFPSRFRKPVRHIAERCSDFNLPEDIWFKLFGEVLRKRGYRDRTLPYSQSWECTYDVPK